MSGEDLTLTEEGVVSVGLCPVRGCEHVNIIVIFYDECELLTSGETQRLPARWCLTRDGVSFGPSDLRCARCNQPMKPVFTRQEISGALERARASGQLDADHQRSARPVGPRNRHKKRVAS